MMRVLKTFPVALVGAALGSCALAGDPVQGVESAATAQASVSLSSSSAAISQTSDSAWTLSKTGTVDTANKTVTWTITATKTSTVAGQLVITGYMAVTNNGGAGATIGNIVVNLQTKSGSSWVSRSVDVADATNGDAATAAAIDPKASSEDKSSFTENSASGSLQFMDASSNTVFSLVPEKTIDPGATVDLLFAATFDNTVLDLPVGKAVRAEVIVSFGNSTNHAPAAANVDINGNGTIDPDEAWVRSVPTRLGLTVPAQSANNSSLTISDGASDISTTGTVTFSNTQVSLGATGGTVTVSYDGGASGGEITNCASATGTGTTVTVGGFSFPVIGGANLQACDTENIGASTCTAGAPGCGWKSGDMLTYSQAEWGSGGSGNSTLLTDFNSVYPGATIFTIGASAGFVAQWSDPTILSSYLPASGPVAALNANLLNATTTSSGIFGGDVAALQLNVDFSDAGYVKGSAGIEFGNLTLCGFSMMPALDGITVRQFLTIANSALAGETTTYSISQLDSVAADLDFAFDGGTPNTFAQTQLVNGSCP